MPRAKFEKRKRRQLKKSRHIDLNSLDINLKSASTEEVVFTVKWPRIVHKLIVMRWVNGRWKIAVEVGQQAQSCYPWTPNAEEASGY